MIISIGEALIDKKYDSRFFGGCPLNVALALSRLGSSSAFLGSVSSDPYGREILNFIIDNCIIFDPCFCGKEERTMTAGVTSVNGKEEYVFDWKGTTAFVMSYEMLENAFIANSDINAAFFGSLTYSDEKCYNQINSFLTKHNKMVRFFDPNIRPAAIEDFDSYRKRIEYSCSFSDFVKVSEDDIQIWEISEKELYNLCSHHLIITRGSNGATWYSKDLGFDKPIHVDGITVPVKDTIGCGDCFSGALLHYLDKNGHLEKSKLCLSESDIYQALFFSVCASAYNATQEGCCPATPEQLYEKS